MPDRVVSTMQNRFCLLALLSVAALAAAGVTWLVLRDRPVLDLSTPHSEALVLPTEKVEVSPSEGGELGLPPIDLGRMSRLRERMLNLEPDVGKDILAEAADRNAAANELFSLPELPDGVVGDLARMFASTDEDEVWRDYCLQFLGSALEREDGVTDEDRALARETLVEALASTNATFAGTALRSLHRGDPSDPLVAASALRIARDSTYPSASRITALLVLEECTAHATDGEADPPADQLSILRETVGSLARDNAASSLLRQTAEAVLRRVDPSRGLE